MKKTFILFLILIVGLPTVLLAQNDIQFTKLLPRSQWSDYSADMPHSAVIIDDYGIDFSCQYYLQKKMKTPESIQKTFMEFFEKVVLCDDD